MRWMCLAAIRLARIQFLSWTNNQPIHVVNGAVAFRWRRSWLPIVALHLMLSILMLGYQNCSPNTQFGSVPQSGPQSESLRDVPEPLGAVAFQIEDGGPVTKNSVLALHLNAENASHVAIFREAGCDEAEANWRAHQPLMPWELLDETDRNRRWQLYARFKRGDEKSACLKAEILHDDAPPRVEWVTVPAAAIASVDAPIEFRSEDPRPHEEAEASGLAQVRCHLEEHRASQSIGAPVLKDCVSGGRIELAVEGRSTLIASAIDKIGNESGEARVSFVVDRTPPRVSQLRIVTAPLVTGRYHPNRVTFSWSGEDVYPDADLTRELSGLAGYECRMDDGAGWSACDPAQASWTQLSVGWHQLMVRAVDRAGNRSGAMNLRFEIEDPISGPFSVLGILSADGRDAMLDDVLARHAVPAVVFSKSEGAQSYEVSIWAGAQRVCAPMSVAQSQFGTQTSFTANFPSTCSLTDGASYTARVIATSAAGGTREAMLNFRVDRSAPQIHFARWKAYPNTDGKTSRGELEMRISDPSGVKSAKCHLKHHADGKLILEAFNCRLDGGLHLYTFSLKAGVDYWIYIESAEDYVGNARGGLYSSSTR
ncbi:MAG TPA: hypothetical protein PLZ57_03565 [Pseudobdellovibrionaceae bacterium]|nr:hypothetical protein [Pseudobdellovibrionaceae bacterium]